MNDPTWCRARLDALEEELLRLGHGESRFAEALEEVRLTWADSAAQEVFGRYLVPHQQETAEARERLLGQLDQLREVVARMIDAEAPAAEIQHLSEDSAVRRQEADNDTESAHHRVDRSLEEAATAQYLANSAILCLESI